MNPTPVYATDNTPAGVSAAFARAAQATRFGPLGPIDPPMIYIPGTARATLPSAPVRAPIRRDPVPAIRAHRYAIAGYACLFDRVSVRANGVREVVKPGAFADAIARGGWSLLLNHRDYRSGGVSLASMRERTLHLAEDAYGLWMEARLPDTADGARIFDSIRRGLIRGLSTGSGSGSGYAIGGGHTLTAIDAWEISLASAPHVPARVGTWVRPSGEAQLRRERMGES